MNKRHAIRFTADLLVVVVACSIATASDQTWDGSDSAAGENERDLIHEGIARNGDFDDRGNNVVSTGHTAPPDGLASTATGQRACGLASSPGSGFAARGQRLVIDSGAAGDMEKFTFYRDFGLGLDGALDRQGGLCADPPETNASDTGTSMLYRSDDCTNIEQANCFTVGDAATPGLDYVSGTVTTVDDAPTGPPTVIWDGQNGGTWDVGTAPNFHFPGGPAGIVKFQNGDSVIFDDTAAMFSVTVAENVAPAAVTFSNTTAYTLGGTASITGSGTLTKRQSGDVLVHWQYLRHGDSQLLGGEVRWEVTEYNYNDTIGFGNGTVTIDNNARLRINDAANSGQSITITNNVVVGAGGGRLSVTGPNLQGVYGTFSGAFSGSGVLTLEGNGNNAAELALTGDNSGFGGTLSVPASGTAGVVIFATQNSVPGGASQPIPIASGGRVRFGNETFVNDVTLNGSAALQASGFSTLTGSLTGGANALTVDRQAILALMPGSGESVSGTGNITLSSGALHAGSLAELFTGNLNLSGGMIVLDGSGAAAPSWAQFSSLYTSYGSGAGQWQRSGGGFAGKGTAVVVPAGGGQTTATWENNLQLGVGSSYCDAGVKIMQAIDLTASRTWYANGVNDSSVNGNHEWTLGSAVNELGGIISDGANSGLTLKLKRSWGGGILRISNPNNDFSGTSLEVACEDQAGRGVVVIFSSDGAFGNPVIARVWGERNSNGYDDGLLLLENTNSVGVQVFSQPIVLRCDRSYAQTVLGGVGSYQGDVLYTGTLSIKNAQYGGEPNAKGAMHVESGQLWLGTNGTPAAIDLNVWESTTEGTFDMWKGGAGEVVLGDISYSHSGTYASKLIWKLVRGTLTTARTGLLSYRNGDPDWDNLFNTGVTNQRTWKAVAVDQSYRMQAGRFDRNARIEVAAGITLTTTNTGTEEFAAVADTATLRKVGAGTWVYGSAENMGVEGAAGWLEVAEGVADLSRNMGLTRLRVDGGTLLAGDGGVSGGTGVFGGSGATWGDGREVAVTTNGGTIGISAAYPNDIRRNGNAALTWDQAGSSTLTLASRQDWSLYLGNSSRDEFPDIAAGNTLRIERDGAGAGRVVLSDLAVACGGTLAGRGTLQLGEAPQDEQGVLTLGAGGTLAPAGVGATGVLEIAGSVTFAAGSTFAVDLQGGDSDVLAVSSNLVLGGTLTATNLAVLGPFANVIATYGGSVSGLANMDVIPSIVDGLLLRVNTNTAHEVRLVGTPPPPTPVVETRDAQNILANSADFVGYLSSTGNWATTVFVYWGPADGGTNGGLPKWAYTNDIGAHNVGLLATNFGGLAEDMTCHYRFYAVNTAGGEWALQSKSFKTVGEPDVDNGIGPSELFIGEAQLNAHLGAEDAEVRICWGADDGVTSTGAWAHAVPFGPRSAGESVSMVVSGLTYGVRYYYRAYATNSAGEGWAAATTNFLTLAPMTETGSGLRYRAYNTISGTTYINPIESLFAQPCDGTGNQTASINYSSFLGFSAITSDDTLSMLWYGWFKVTEADTYSFAVNHDDGAAVFIDRNGDGDYQDAGEQIVYSSGAGTHSGDIALGRGWYRIAIGFFENTGGQYCRVRWMRGAGKTYNDMTLYVPNGPFYRDAYEAVGVASDGASNIGYHQADLNGTLQATSAVFTVTLYWGETDGTNNPAAWTNSLPMGTYSNVVSQPLSHTVTGLRSNRTRYWYTYRAQNVAADRWATPSATFETKRKGSLLKLR